MPKYIKKKTLKNAIERCTWYHINKNGELIEGANSSEHEPLYKYSDIKKIIKGLPTRKFEDEPKRTALSKALKWTYGERKAEPQICDFCRYYNSSIPCGSTPSACKEADKFAEEFVDGLKKLKPKDEPQTDCGWK